MNKPFHLNSQAALGQPKAHLDSGKSPEGDLFPSQQMMILPLSMQELSAISGGWGNIDPI